MNDLFQQSPVAQAVGLRDIMLQREKLQQDMAKQQQAMDLEKQLFPEKLRQQQLMNQTAEAQIPGIQAQSSIAGDNARFSAETIGKKIDTELSNLKGKIGENELRQLSAAGAAFAQAGGALEGVPYAAAHARAKQLLGSHYMPELDQVSPGALGQVLSMMGEKMQTAGTKFLTTAYGVDKKTESAERIATGKNATEIEKARIAAQARMAQFSKDYEEAKAAAKAKYGGYPQQSGYYSAKALEVAEQAALEGDPEALQSALRMAKVYAQMAEEAKQQEIKKAVAAAVEGNKAKPDINAVGIPTVTPPGAQPGGPNPVLSPNNPSVSPSGQTPMGSPEVFKQAFGAYEPDKYEYRMGPNGPQRRKKQ